MPQLSFPALVFSLLVVLGSSLTAAQEAGDSFPEPVNSQKPGDRPPTPQEAAGKISVPEGFHVRLIAGEPDVRQPIAFDFDDRGRLWVVECYTYAKRGYAGQFRDRVLIFDLPKASFHKVPSHKVPSHKASSHQEPSNKASAGQVPVWEEPLRKVFWDRGQQTTGLVWGFGGLWILSGGKLLFLPDRNGDDRPDGPPVVHLQGFDHNRVGHNIVNGLLWGPDGWLYGRHGIQATSHVRGPTDPPEKSVKLNCSIWRYHPTEKVFEVVTHGTTNPWGMDYNDYGEMFFTNNVIGHLWHVVPGAHYRRMYGEDFNPHLYGLLGQCADHYHWDAGKSWTASRNAGGKHGELGGGHSHCGGMIYLGDSWPQKYRNQIFMCNTHGRRVNVNVLKRDRSGYVGQRAPDFLFANQPWFRGVELRYGPDGSVFLTDWCDSGECHDHDGVHRTSGRIYQVLYASAADSKVLAPSALDGQWDGFGPSPPDSQVLQEQGLAGLSNEQLVSLTQHPNDWFVRRARRLLQERASSQDHLGELEEAFKRLRGLLSSQSKVALRLRALWALSGSGGIGPEELLKLTRDPNEHMRVWAIRLLVDQQEPSAEAIDRFVDLARGDPSGLVRLYLASSLQRLSLRNRLRVALPLSGHQQDLSDPMLPLMIWYGIEPAVVAHPREARKLLKQTAIPLLKKHIARRLTSELANDPQAVADLVDGLADCPTDEQKEVLRGMVEAVRGWRQATGPATWPQLQSVLLTSPDAEIRGLTRELSVIFGDGQSFEALRKIASNPQKPGPQRREALRVLVEAGQVEPGNKELGNKELAPLLLRLVNDRATAKEAIRGLARHHHPNTPQVILKAYRRLRNGSRQEAINTLASRPSFALALLEACQQGRVSKTDLSAAQARQLYALGDAKVREKLEQVWGVVRPTPAQKQALIDQLKAEFTREHLAKADQSQGRLVFNRLCANCHKLYGAGGTIGPELTGGNRQNLDYLLQNTIAPSAVVGDQFLMSNVLTQEGRLITGVIVARTDRTVAVQTPRERVVLDQGDIEEIVRTEQSLMPEGLLKPLSPEERAALFAYLSGNRQVPLPERAQRQTPISGPR